MSDWTGLIGTRVQSDISDFRFLSNGIPLLAVVGLFFGAMITAAPVRPGQQPPPEFIGWFFAAFGLFFFVDWLTLGILKFLAYRKLKERRSRVFCMVVAGISCIGIPYRTLLEVSTLIVLSRPSVIELFDR